MLYTTIVLLAFPTISQSPSCWRPSESSSPSSWSLPSAPTSSGDRWPLWAETDGQRCVWDLHSGCALLPFRKVKIRCKDRQMNVICMAIDSIGKMTVGEEMAKFSSMYMGKKYYFCSPGCREKVRHWPAEIFLILNDTRFRAIIKNHLFPFISGHFPTILK